MDPGDIVRNVMHGSHTSQSMRLAIGLENKTKTNAISKAVPTLRKSLACEAVTKVVHPIVSNGPIMTHGHASRMTPNQWSNIAWKPLGKILSITNVVQTDKKIL